MSRPLPPTAAPLQAEALGLSLQRILAHPLATLRASIAALASDLERRGQEPGAALDGVLEEIVRLARDVETLVELAAPRPLAPMRCSVDEIAHSALRGLDEGERARVRYARDEQAIALLVDGPLVARCLTYLLQATLTGAPDQVLLSGRRERDLAVFSLVHSGERSSALSARIDPAQGREDLARAVRIEAAERDLARMGAHLDSAPTERGLTCIRVELPLDPVRPSGRRESTR